jgi:hypothetical protein
VLLLLVLLPTLLEVVGAAVDASSAAEDILAAAKLCPCFICLYCKAAATARLLLKPLLLLAWGCCRV